MPLQDLTSARFQHILVEDQNRWKSDPGILDRKAKHHQRHLMRILPHLMVSGDPDLYHLIKGPRRSGKSTLLWQTIKVLLERYGIQAEQIFYFQMDHPELRPEPIGGLVETLLEFAPATSHSNPLFLFIDEIGLSPDWRGWLKMFSDNSKPLRILASSSAFAYSRAKESYDSGIDRWQEHELMPCGFLEFLEMYFAEPNMLPAWCWTRCRSLKERLESIPPNTVLDPRIHQALRQMMLLGGYPRCITDFKYSEMTDEADRTEDAHDYLREIAERVAYQDIPTTQPIKDTPRMMRLLHSCARGMCRQTTISKIGKAANINNAVTTLAYMELLERSSLIFRLHAHLETPSRNDEGESGDGRQASKGTPKNQKLVFRDTAMPAAIRRAGVFSVNDDEQKGWGYENMAGAALKELADNAGAMLNFWRLEDRYETDFIYDSTGEGILGIEIGSSPNHNRKSLVKCMKEIPQLQDSCYLVTPDSPVIHPRLSTEGIGEMPLAAFLLAANAQSIQHALTKGGRIKGGSYRVKTATRELLDRPDASQPSFRDGDTVFLTAPEAETAKEKDLIG